MSRPARQDPRCGPWEMDEDGDAFRCRQCDSLPGHTCPVGDVRALLDAEEAWERAVLDGTWTPRDGDGNR